MCSPVPSSSKQANALRMTSSGSVPLSFSPNIVRNIVKFMGPGASVIIASKYSSFGSFPERQRSDAQTCETLDHKTGQKGPFLKLKNK